MPDDHYLLRSQRNDVFAAIQNAGFNPSDFEWETFPMRATEFGSGWQVPKVPAIIHRPSSAFFVFDFDQSRKHHYANYIPGEERPEEFINAGDWPTELQYVWRWLELLKREYDAPDLWAELARQRELVAGEPRTDEAHNAPFSRDEQEQIARHLQEIKEHLGANYELTAEQSRHIDKRLAYLEDAARRGVGRTDWRNLVIGTLLGVVVEAIVPPEPIRAALGLILRGLGNLLGGAVPEFPPTY